MHTCFDDVAARTDDSVSRNEESGAHDLWKVGLICRELRRDRNDRRSHQVVASCKAHTKQSSQKMRYEPGARLADRHGDSADCSSQRDSLRPTLRATPENG